MIIIVDKWLLSLTFMSFKKKKLVNPESFCFALTSLHIQEIAQPPPLMQMEGSIHGRNCTPCRPRSLQSEVPLCGLNGRPQKSDHSLKGRAVICHWFCVPTFPVILYLPKCFCFGIMLIWTFACYNDCRGHLFACWYLKALKSEN